MEGQLADLCFDKAHVHSDTDDLGGAVASYDRAIQLYERLVNLRSLAFAYGNKAITLRVSGDLVGAVGLYKSAIKIYKGLLCEEYDQQLAKHLAADCINMAVAMKDLGDILGAVTSCDHAIPREKAKTLNLAVDEVETVAAIETLGIPLGAPLAYQLRMGLALFRKSVDDEKRGDFAYKEYSDSGTEQGKPKTMKVLRTSIRGKRILIVDEIIDGGGQFLAACHLIEECEGIFVAGLVKAACHPSGDEWSPPHPELQKSGYVLKELDTDGLYLVQRAENAPKGGAIFIL